MQQEKEHDNNLENTNINTVNVQKGKFNLTFDANKISDKEKFKEREQDTPIILDEPTTNTEPSPIDDTTKTTKENNTIKLKSVMQILNVTLFTGAFVSIVCGMIFLERPTISESENRTLNKFPTFSFNSLLDGSYTAGISDWFNDTVPYRDVFKDISAKFRSMLGIEYDGVIVVNIDGNGVSNKDTESTTNESTITTAPTETIVTTTPVVEIGISDTTQTEVTTETTTVTTDNLIEMEEDLQDDNGGLGELSNNIMIYQKRAIPIYYGNFDRGVEYATYVNNYKSDLGKDVNVYSMVCPTSMSFYWPENSDVSHGSEEDNITNINENLKDVTPINLIPVLSEHTAEHIYSRTDHHWQPLGAYYSAQEFCKIANVPFNDLSTYTKHTIENYVGTLYGYSGSIIIKENPEDFVYYEPSNEYSTDYYDIDNNFQNSGKLLVEATGSSAYLTFMGGDEKIVHVTTDTKNGRNLVIIKDSYGNALVPFLTGSFENIYVIDMRHFNLNAIEYIKDVKATDVLFAMNTFSATGSNYRELEKIRTQ